MVVAVDDASNKRIGVARNSMGNGISAVWLAVIIVSAVILGTVVVVAAMQSGMWFGGMMSRYHGWMHDEDNFKNGTLLNQNDTDGLWCL